MTNKLQGRFPTHERKEAYINLQRLYFKKYGENFPEIVFNLDDLGSQTWEHRKEHSMTYHKVKAHMKQMCGPDFSFWHWPCSNIKSSSETFNMILEAGRSKPKTNKVAWFGNIKSPGASRPEHKTRPHLVNHYGKRYPDRFKFSNAGPGAGLPQHFVSLADQTREYKYLLDIGGNGYSARLKFLLFSGRPTMVVERDYVEYFWDDLKPYEHYIPVKMDLSDLVEQHQWAVDNDKAAVEIAENARDFAIKNFTMDKAMERFQEVFQNFKRLQA